jgi:hypothetical protein
MNFRVDENLCHECSVIPIASDKCCALFMRSFGGTTVGTRYRVASRTWISCNSVTEVTHVIQQRTGAHRDSSWVQQGLSCSSTSHLNTMSFLRHLVRKVRLVRF